MSLSINPEFSDKSPSIYISVPVKGVVNQVALAKLQGKENEFLIYYWSDHWVISYNRGGEVSTEEIDPKHQKLITQDPAGAIKLFREALGLERGTILPLKQEAPLASPVVSKGFTEVRKAPYLRIPGVDGICILNDSIGTESTTNNRAFTNELVDICRNGVPLITTPHLLINVFKEQKLSMSGVKDYYNLYFSKGNNYLVLIPKKPLGLTPNHLCLTNIQQIPEKDINPQDLSFLAANASRTKFSDLKTLFEKPKGNPLRISLYLGGHGNDKSVFGLPDADYQEFLSHLNQVYSISAATVSSCEPHGIEPKISGILIREGIPFRDGTVKYRHYLRYFEELNRIESADLFSKANREHLKEAFKHTGQADHTNLSTIWFPFGLIPSGRSEESLGRMNWTYRIQQQFLLKGSGVRIKPDIKEMHLYLPDLTAVDLVFPRAIPIMSHIKDHSFFLFKSITIEEPMSLEAYVRHAFLNEHQDFRGAHVFRSVANHRFLIKKLVLGDVEYENLIVTLEKDKPPKWEYIKRTPAATEGEQDFKGIGAGSIASGRGREMFLASVLQSLQKVRTSDEVLLEATGGHQTFKSMLNSIQEHFFPEEQWLSLLESPRELGAFLRRQKPLDPILRGIILYYVVDRNYHLLEPSLLEIEPSLKMRISYETASAFRDDVIRVVQGGVEANEALRKLKCYLFYHPNQVLEEPLQKGYAIDMAIKAGNVELVKLLLSHQARPTLYQLHSLFGSPLYHGIGFTQGHTEVFKLLIQKEVERRIKEPKSLPIISDECAGWMIEGRVHVDVFKPLIIHWKQNNIPLNDNLFEIILSRGDGDLLIQLAELIPTCPTVGLLGKGKDKIEQLKERALNHVLTTKSTLALSLLDKRGWIDPKKIAGESKDNNLLAFLLSSGLISPSKKSINEWHVRAIAEDNLELYQALDHKSIGYLQHLQKQGEEDFIKNEIREASKKPSVDVFTYLVQRWKLLKRDLSWADILKITNGKLPESSLIIYALLKLDLECHDANTLYKIIDHSSSFWNATFGQTCTEYFLRKQRTVPLSNDQLESLMLYFRYKGDVELYKILFSYNLSKIRDADIHQFYEIFASEFYSLRGDSKKIDFLEKRMFSWIMRKFSLATIMDECFTRLENTKWHMDEKEAVQMFPHILKFWEREPTRHTIDLIEKLLKELEENNAAALSNYRNEKDNPWERKSPRHYKIGSKIELIGICLKQGFINKKIRPSDAMTQRLSQVASRLRNWDDGLRSLIQELASLPEDHQIMLPDTPPEPPIFEEAS